MYTAGTTDPSGTVTTGQTTAPTAAPTSFPTRAPSDAPTAYPTKAPSTVPTAYPTEAPTDYPTALAHADDALQVACAYNTAVYNITVEANSTVVSVMIATPAAPTTAPTTAYPTAAPTKAPTEAAFEPYSEGTIVHTNKPYSSSWDGSASFSSDPNAWLRVDPTTGAMTQKQYGTWGFTTAAIETMVGGSINSEWSLKIPFEWDSLGDHYIQFGVNCPTTNWGPNYAGGLGSEQRSFIVQRWPSGIPNFQAGGGQNAWQHVATGNSLGSRENLRADFFSTSSPRNLLLTRTADKGFKIDIVDSAGNSKFGAGGVELKSSFSGFDIGNNRLPFCIFNNHDTSTYSTPVVV
jgi:hypothetical protein